MLGFVSQMTCFVGTRGTWCPVKLGELAILPTTDSQKKADNISLLLSLNFGHVLVRSHLDGLKAFHMIKFNFNSIFALPPKILTTPKNHESKLKKNTDLNICVVYLLKIYNSSHAVIYHQTSREKMRLKTLLETS